MTHSELSDLGWSDTTAIPDGAAAMRVTAVHRSQVDLLGTDGPTRAPVFAEPLAVGDWVFVTEGRITALVPRKSFLARRAAGEGRAAQPIAANVDTLGIVSSCNADFNVARIERYVAMALQGDCLPLVILTKADLCDDPRGFRQQAERISPLVTAMTLNARDPEEARSLDPWCRNGQTLALVGMSGVGKTTLQNALTGEEAATAGIREDDARGRHTTTNRMMRRTLAGGWLIDTPGMRELGLTDVAEGIAEVFSDITDLAPSCRFRDCAHDGEPGCAVTAAVEEGQLDPDRLDRWRKLQREDQINSETIAEGRARHKSRQKLYKTGAAQGRAKRSGLE
ncbi:ribosome small subunit-dependent GTPase A [Pseudooceanicola atlanticus]|uniref:Small ribosomal subunit biogenesis GTPase RsgA n=1 Tax=Pseudooceanicola atlanticus TaxID=1461694 RepID=A0A0A0EJ32_9RHOB|nr:ribosome small subunit-dependent GTPase A [Pseudooceanicola atlanticus]KGM50359.1 GTPase RsgA [Pseudooceanicola atlanticus]